MPLIRSLPLSLSLALYASGILAQPPESSLIPASPELESLTPSDRRATTPSSPPRITQAMLRHDPALSAAILDQAVNDGQWQVVKEVLPIYERTSGADSTLVLFARGGLARSENNLSQAIANYRRILATTPHFTRVRLELARALFDDRQYQSAAWHFSKTRSENPPAGVLENIDHYLALINQRTGCNGNFAISYLKDNNINNASDGKYIRIGNRTLIRDKASYPQKGEGVFVSATLLRDVQLYGRHSLRFKAAAEGKIWWDNHDYNDITSRIYSGWLWQNNQQQITLLPFYEKRWYGSSAYTSGAGVRAEYKYLPTPDWQTSNTLEYQKLDYDNASYDYLRGHSTLFSSTLSHAFSARFSAFTGVDIGQQDTRSAGETYWRYGMRTGFESQLPWKISLATMVGISKKQYQGENDIFRKKRADDEAVYILSLWHRDLHVMGVMPKLNYIYKRVTSNIDYYQYSENSVYLTFDRQF
ncbi:porin family protein [Entomohabitans teleogrylli]|uniref:porin family protein n=1 Tax=Entomohabitans teleogrylli TaxID=1384589 RepID=UPI00073DAC01|nr:porin family protein [Entomohabitans teleogrylli]